MRVALICPTIGQTRRGYERYVSDLFRFTQDCIEIIIFKGGGARSPRERVVPHISRTGVLSRLCGGSFRYLRYRLEFASFAAAVWPRLMAGRFDLIHFIDPPLGPHFARLRRLTRLKVSLLFSNAGPVSFDASHWADHIHCLSPMALAEAQQLGIAPNRLTLVPIGVDAGALKPSAPSAELRREFGVHPDRFVILAMASVNRHHKRVDHLIEEVAAMPGDSLLWLDGSLHPDGDRSLIELGRLKLGERFRHTHLPSDRVADLYALADILVSAAVQESFGMAISEAMAAGLPVLVHDSPHFRWLVGEQGHFTNMTFHGALRTRLSEFIAAPESMREVVNTRAVLERFGWPAVASQHLNMYEQAVSRRCGLTVFRPARRQY